MKRSNTKRMLQQSPVVGLLALFGVVTACVPTNVDDLRKSSTFAKTYHVDAKPSVVFERIRASSLRCLKKNYPNMPKSKDEQRGRAITGGITPGIIHFEGGFDVRSQTGSLRQVIEGFFGQRTLLTVAEVSPSGSGTKLIAMTRMITAGMAPDQKKLIYIAAQGKDMCPDR